MIDQNSKAIHTAIHEAGHAVSCVRLGIDHDKASIVPEGDWLGHVQSAGVNHVWMEEEAVDQVLSYCAGYAALVAAGFDETVATQGADGDFDAARHLIEHWGLAGDLDEWKAKAVAMMQEPRNRAAVKRVADELVAAGTIDWDDISCCCDIADGECTEEDYAMSKALRRGSG